MVNEASAKNADLLTDGDKMRPICRRPLPKRANAYLVRKQGEVDRGADARSAWLSSRKTRTMRRVADALADLTGPRRRCMYCEDSRGAEIDHFWPITPYHERAFRWDNMLWLCGACNRKKGNRFALDENRDPLLIDPTAEDPWDHLFFDSHTGNITARFSNNVPSAKGNHTTDSRILPLNIEAVTNGRLRVARNLKRFVSAFLNTDLCGEDEFLDSIRDNDDYGLTIWYFARDGSEEPPFCDLKKRSPRIWNNIRSALSLR
jgi:uncharacterized protein (TIGR02646 family)